MPSNIQHYRWLGEGKLYRSGMDNPLAIIQDWPKNWAKKRLWPIWATFFKMMQYGQIWYRWTRLDVRNNNM